MLTAALDEVVHGPTTDDRFGKHLIIVPTVPASRAGRFATQAVVVTAAARRIIELSKANEKLAKIVVSGDADPTLHPDFRQISENLRELANKWFPRAKLCLESAAPRLAHPDARQGLLCYDRAFVRFEAGTQKTFTALTGESGQEFKQLVEDLSSLDLSNIVIRACFQRGSVDNSTENEVRAWLRYVASFRPAQLEIWTPAKADSATKTKPITKTRMAEIVEKIGAKITAPVEVLDPQ